jgi:hypothetical protein
MVVSFELLPTSTCLSSSISTSFPAMSS